MVGVPCSGFFYTFSPVNLCVKVCRYLNIGADFRLSLWSFILYFTAAGASSPLPARY
nr:MAG TPA: hypothetical protein [Caudoviricetes sp.]